MPPDPIKVKSLYKALKLLDYFTKENPERGTVELAQLSGVGKSTVHNIMSTFETCGFVKKNPRTNQYCLGYQILHLSNCLLATSDFRKLVRPYMEKLCEATGQNIYLGVPSNYVVLYMESVFPNPIWTSKNIIGSRAPMYCTGIGKAMLAFLPEPALEIVIKQGLLAYTPNTIVTPEGLYAEIQRIRECGYAVDNMEHEYGIRCVGAPIRNIENTVIGAISISGLSTNITEEKVREYSVLLSNAAADISPILDITF